MIQCLSYISVGTVGHDGEPLPSFGIQKQSIYRPSTSTLRRQAYNRGDKNVSNATVSIVGGDPKRKSSAPA